MTKSLWELALIFLTVKESRKDAFFARDSFLKRSCWKGCWRDLLLLQFVERSYHNYSQSLLCLSLSPPLPTPPTPHPPAPCVCMQRATESWQHYLNSYWKSETSQLLLHYWVAAIPVCASSKLHPPIEKPLVSPLSRQSCGLTQQKAGWGGGRELWGYSEPVCSLRSIRFQGFCAINV